MDEKIKQIAEHYGFDSQKEQCNEEMAELTIALNKFWRKNLLCGEVKITTELLERLKKTPEYENVLEELADVMNMILQIEYLLDMDISEMADYKLKRELERIDSECSN